MQKTKKQSNPEKDCVDHELPDFPYARLLSQDPLMNPSQWRIDFWNECREITSRICENMSLKEELAKKSVKDLEEKLKEEKFLSYEPFWAFPGRSVLENLGTLLKNGSFENPSSPDNNFKILDTKLRTVVRLLSHYEDKALRIYQQLDEKHTNLAVVLEGSKKVKKHFTVLVIDDMPNEIRMQVLEQLKRLERTVDDFVYDVVFVDNIEDAIIAALYNNSILACIIRQDLPLRGKRSGEEKMFDNFMAKWEKHLEAKSCTKPRGIECGNLLRELLPNLDLYLVSDTAIQISKEDTTAFDRVFYRYDDLSETHITLLDGIRKKYRTPFFDSLQKYAQRPVGNFHALPIARGHSVFNSPWLQDMRDFYGDNIFLAETSSTTGGLDSLLDPKGTIKEAQDAAAKTFGAQHTFFATNGTSTSNKIVVQALVKPEDIVLIDRNCHKSHHYGIVLSGAKPLYLDAYWKGEYALYGAVSLQDSIIAKLNELAEKGLLHKVKMLLLTNCTFDGIVYNPGHVMEEVLGVLEKFFNEGLKKLFEKGLEKHLGKNLKTCSKNDLEELLEKDLKKDLRKELKELLEIPKIYFLWDEAWFGYARFFPSTRRRTACTWQKNFQKDFRAISTCTFFLPNRLTSHYLPYGKDQ